MNSTLKAKVHAWSNTPQLNYKILLGITAILTGIGLVMVLSSSMVTSIAAGSSVWSEFIRQAIVVFLGLVGMWCALRMSPQTIGRFSPLLLLVAFAMLIAVLIPGIGVGDEEVGARSWIRIGPIGVQPSEAAKLALAVFGSWTVSKKLRQTDVLNKALGAFFAVSFCMLALVLLQNDLGMMLTVGIVVMAILFFSGVSTRIFLGLLVVLGALGFVAINVARYRSARISTWLDTLMLNFPEATNRGVAYQSYQGMLSLSDGGFTGIGLGQSRAKWFYLPEAKNDFIFAVLGEELGLLGAIFVVFLFTCLGVFGIRTALKQIDPFMRLLAATLTVGIVVQAFYNMGYVMGLFPVTGIQLPLISAGGSSAIITLITLGILANCARHEPETVSSMQHEGRPLIDRILLLPEPQVYKPGSARRKQRRETMQRYGAPVTSRAYSGRRSVGQDIRQAVEEENAAIRRVGGDPDKRGYDRNRSGSLPPRRSSRRSSGNSTRSAHSSRPIRSRRDTNRD